MFFGKDMGLVAAATVLSHMNYFGAKGYSYEFGPKRSTKTPIEDRKKAYRAKKKAAKKSQQAQRSK